MRALKLDSKFLFENGENAMVLKAFAPLATKEHKLWQEIYNLGGIGFTTMMWQSAMDGAVRFRKHFKTCLRYEDLIVSKEALAHALLEKCGFDSGTAKVDANEIAAVFASDAHGEQSTTTSKRFKLGSGRLFVTPSDVAKIEEILSTHSIVNSSDFIIQDTLKA